MSAKYKSPSFLLPNELNTSANPANDTGINSLYSMDFDSSSSDYIDLGNVTSLNNLTAFSTSNWFKTSNVSTAPVILNGGSSSTNRFYLQLLTNGTTIRYVIGSSVEDVTVSNIADGNWHHISTVQNGTSLDIYLDGAKQNTSTITVVSPSTNIGNNFKIGRYFLSAANYFDGLIDEVAIFNRALDSTEIAALYGGTSPNIYPSNLMATDLNPIAYYPLGEQAQNSGYPSATGNEWQFPNGVLQDYVMDFDGGDNVNIVDAPSSNGTQTLSMWINTSTSGNNGGLFTIVSNGATSDYWSVALWNSNIHCSTANTGSSKQSTTNVADGDWHNIIFVKSSSVCTHMYIDGDIQTLSNGSWQGSINTPQEKIGSGNYSNTEYYFTGKISNVVLWTSDQSSNKDNIYNNGSPQTSYIVSPQNWWKLNADSVFAPSAPNYTTALDFTSPDLISINSSITIDTTQPYSISAWVYLDSTSNQVIIAGNTSGGTSNFVVPLVIKSVSGSFAAIATHQENSSGIFRQSNSIAKSELTSGWSHIVLVKDGVNCSFFYNGQPYGTASFSTTPPATIELTTIGKGFNNWYLNGRLSNLAIFDSGLTASQISTLFNFGTPETNISFSPQAWWKLNDQNAITDSSGNGNTGTNNGAANFPSGIAVTPVWKIPSALTVPTVNTTSAINIGTAGTNPGPIGLNPYFDFDLSSVTTTSLWIKPPASGSAQQGTILGNNGATGGATGDQTILLAWRGSSVAPYNKVIETYDYGWLGNKVVSNSFSNDFWYGNWHHILMIRNNQNVSFFVDGVSAGGGTFASSQSTTPVNVNAIGGALSNWYFQNGEISNLAIWNSDQSSNVSNIYNSGQPQSSYTVTPNHLFKLDNLTTGINDVYSSSAGTATSGVTKVDTNVYVGNIPVNGVSTTLPSTALQQSDLQFDSPYSNYSLSFDGSTSFIDCGNDSSLSISGDLTISAWVNIDVHKQLNGIISKVSSTDRNYEILVRDTGQVSFYTSPTEFTTSTQAISVNTWTNIIVTVESGVTNGVKFYFNGVKDSTTGTQTVVSNTANLNIGRRTTGSFYMDGFIDETSIFNYSLSEAQVLEIYNNGRPNDLTTFSGTAPISWWRLGENAYFDNNSFVVPNSISGAPNGTGSGSITTMISADAPGTYANGIGTNLDILDRVGDAALSTSNSQSYNMIPSDISPYVPQYVGDQIANNFSMTFDAASNTSFNAGQTLNIYGSQPRTISCWFNINSFATTSSGDGSNLLGYGASTTLQAFSIAVTKYPSNPTHRIFLHVWSSAQDISGTTQILENNWYLATVTYDGSTLKLYLNGNLEGSSSTSSLNTATSDFIIGQGVFSTWNTLNGKIDEVAIFDTALNAGQIYNDIYQPTATGTNQTADLVNNPNLPNPVAWYRMGD